MMLKAKGEGTCWCFLLLITSVHELIEIKNQAETKPEY